MSLSVDNTYYPCIMENKSGLTRPVIGQLPLMLLSHWSIKPTNIWLPPGSLPDSNRYILAKKFEHETMVADLLSHKLLP